MRDPALGSLIRFAFVGFALFAASCGGADQAPPTTTPPTTSAQTTAGPTTTATTFPATTSPSTTSAPSLTSAGLSYRQAAENTDDYSYTIAYPVLVDAEGQLVVGANDALITWVEETIADFKADADTLDAKATLTAQVAPELVSDSVLSLSGVSSSFVDAAAGTISRRHAWIVDLDTGATVNVQDLLLDGDLTPLADAARAHLIADILGSEDQLSGPDGLLPVAANFDSVWLTATGIGVGFDEGQVAAPEAGSPAVFIPFAELEVFLIKEGVLAPLREADRLPEL
ncbi:MAG: hypothetical protein HKN91_18155 [Acidimicrobiia bacterium]|nr:hypothetical protein [Acidimicrobiia bacterium]